jgi:23S rRNA pseudouridine1911/1915/1917 synthase
LQHAVTPDEAGKRADVIVARLSGAPRSLVADAVKRGDVRVNGTAVKASYTLELGDLLEYDVASRTPLVATPEAIDVPIVFEDDDIVVVDKPAGMVTHPAHGATSGTLVNALLAHIGTLPGDPLRPGLVHRLDRDTSGLMVVAKTAEALSALGIAMKAREIKREYLGLVHGVPEHAKGTIDGPIGRDPHNRLKYAIVGDGKPAVTHYELREVFPKAAELLFRLGTGRTHQIRVHLAAMGHPIVNDPVYGHEEARFGLPGQALHAWRLAFRHPRTDRELQFEIDPPAEYTYARVLLRG